MLAFFAKTNYLYDPVAAIEDAGVQNVYSIRVDSDCHSFVANGFINHNTEARMSPFATEMLQDLDRDTVDWTDNYDQTRQEPTVLPGKFPNFLCNGGSGIAVGMATNMPPHNLREVVDGAIHLLDNPDATSEDLMEFIKGPDFPTSGLILGTKGIRQAYATGRGSVIMQARTSIEPIENGPQPDRHHRTALSGHQGAPDRADRRSGQAEEDRGHRRPQRLLRPARDAGRRHAQARGVPQEGPELPAQAHAAAHDLRRQHARAGRRPAAHADAAAARSTHFLDHRREVIVRRTLFELNKAKARAHILEGLQIALDFLDEIIALIRARRARRRSPAPR